MRTRIVVYSNNGQIGHCSSFVFFCAKVWHNLLGYSCLRKIGSYVR